MKRIAFAVAAWMFAVVAIGAEAPAECTICVGTALAPSGASVVPLVVRIAPEGFPDSPAVDALTPQQRSKTLLILPWTIPSGATLTDVEGQARALVEWARQHGPFDTLSFALEGTDPALLAYGVKRAAVSAQGLSVTSRIGVGPVGLPVYEALLSQESQSYFDVAVVRGTDVEPSAKFFAERDPSKKIFALVAPQSPNPMYDVARALADGATRAYAETRLSPAAAASMNRALGGDFAADPTAETEVLDAKGNASPTPVITFVRGEDLRSLLVPRGDAGPVILALPTDRFERPLRIDAAGERAIKDTGKKGGRLLIGVQPSADGYAIVADRAEKLDTNVTKEAIEVATQRGITVEEIIRNHQAYDAYQESVAPRYVARNTTKLRFEIAAAEAMEAAIAGDYFSDPAGKADWVWQDFYVNGVKWKYGRIPELPLIQPEKVTQLPLDIHLTNEYRYQLVRENDLLGYKTYEVRFEPPSNAPSGLPLYRGTVWIDARSWARIRISTVQLNLTGEVLSNEERVDFVPFARETKAQLTPEQVSKTDPREVIWLPLEVRAQQVISAAGRASVVQRETTFTNFRLDPEDFETRLGEIASSDARMVRETEAGLRYLEKRPDGERVVKEGFDTSQMFMLGGIHHDEGLQYPVVPLGGVDYFNFNLANKGIQTNVFFAGVIVAANATHPNVANTRTNVGADFFGIAVPTDNTMFRGGMERPEEAVKSLPTLLSLRAGHPVGQFAKVDVNFTTTHLTYQEADDTAADFAVPVDTFQLTPSIEWRYTRRGYSLNAFYDYTTRTSWEPWGILSEYSDDQKTFTHFGASIAKSFYLPKFQRISVNVNYLDGQRLDRFSKYELGFFGSNRVHGVRSGSVRAERGFIGHLSYGFVFSQQFRMEAFYDHAVLDDELAGHRREPFQGLGIAGQTVGPYGTLLRLDIGKTIGRNRQQGFVADVVFLKLF